MMDEMDAQDLVEWFGRQLAEDEAFLLIASGTSLVAYWSLDEWFGREVPHSLIASGSARQPTALGHFTADPVPTAQAKHIARHDPARVFAEVRAKRAVRDLVEKALRESRDEDFLVAGPARAQFVALMPVLRHLAVPYEDQPGYREEWRP